MLEEGGHKTIEKPGEIRETHTVSGGGDHIRSDHDNARYLEIYSHCRDVLFETSSRNTGIS